MKRCVIFLCLFSTSFFLFSRELATDPGINLLVVNEEKATSDDRGVLLLGNNQVVITFTGYLSTKGKTKYFSSLPYVITLPIIEDQNVRVSLLSKNYEKIASLVENGSPIFQFLSSKGTELESTQSILPSNDGFMPYMNTLALVQNYNKEHNITYSPAQYLRDEKMNCITSEENGCVEHENLIQLKIWYGRASQDERDKFIKWLSAY
ncbi:DUF2057 family protein [Vibrio ordalii]|uniref:DUF2057 family protein n=1 Tax=Vibrio ordalii TaxID=28174 RepID=UPI0002FEC9B7|nr:DUF2057 family protein [Vibrio ordalii]OEE73886.1 hypothetical protein A1QQ_00770 [Vibrio ordalii FF-167]